MFKKVLLILAISFSQLSLAGNYVVGVENITYYPFYAYDKDTNEYKGIARDIFDEFSKYSGHNFSYLALPPDLLFRKFFLGEVDFKYPDNEKWHSDSRGDNKSKLNISYVKVMSFIDGVIVTKNNYEKKISRVISVRGFKPWVLMDDPKYQILETNDFPSAIVSVLLGRVDGVYGNPEVVRYNFLNNPKLKDRGKYGDLMQFADYLPNTGKDFYYLSTLKHHDIINEFEKFLAKTGIINKFKKKYEIRETLDL